MEIIRDAGITYQVFPAGPIAATRINSSPNSFLMLCSVSFIFSPKGDWRSLYWLRHHEPRDKPASQLYLYDNGIKASSFEFSTPKSADLRFGKTPVIGDFAPMQLRPLPGSATPVTVPEQRSAYYLDPKGLFSV